MSQFDPLRPEGFETDLNAWGKVLAGKMSGMSQRQALRYASAQVVELIDATEGRPVDALEGAKHLN